MKTLRLAIIPLILSLLIPVLALAQNQGDDVPLGHGVDFPSCQARSAMVATAATGKLNYPSCEVDGRIITSPYAPPGDSWAGCSVEATGTSNTQIKAAPGAGIRTYVTSISCTNDSLVPSEINFKNGTGYFYTGWVMANTGNSGFQVTFPVPLRLTANTAFNFSMTTTGTSTFCCAAGYTSTI